MTNFRVDFLFVLESESKERFVLGRLHEICASFNVSEFSYGLTFLKTGEWVISFASVSPLSQELIEGVAQLVQAVGAMEIMRLDSESTSPRYTVVIKTNLKLLGRNYVLDELYEQLYNTSARLGINIEDIKFQNGYLVYTFEGSRSFLDRERIAITRTIKDYCTYPVIIEITVE